MALYLVTGGCGFIGSNLVHALLGHGAASPVGGPEATDGNRVRVLDNLSTGRQQNLRELLASSGGPATGGGPRLELIRGDITDPDVVSRAMVGVDYVLHQAAMPSVPWSIEHPLECERINVVGTLQVLEAVRRENQRRHGQSPMRRVVLAVSCAAYGDLDPEKPKQETDPVAPLSPYAAAKIACEHLAAIYSQTYGVPTVALRYFNVYGPRQDPASQYAAVVPRFINAALAGQRPTVFGDGLQSRDFVYVDNVIDANLLACQAPAERVAGQVFNIGCGQGTSLLELIDALSELTGQAITPEHHPARPGEVRHSRSDIRRAGERLGYQPRYLLRDGLARTLAWYREAAKGRPA